MRYDALLLDLDGTLIDSSLDLAAAVNEARRALGLDALSVATVNGFVGDGVPLLIERSFPAAGEGEIEKATLIFRRHYAAHLLDHTRPYPGVPEVLARLRAQGLAMAVVTNKPLAMALECLKGLDLLPWLGAVQGGDGKAGRKPDPGPFQAAMEALGALPRETLMVGDGKPDILGARRAGIAVAAVTYGLGEARLLRSLKPDFLLDSFSELPAIMEAEAG